MQKNGYTFATVYNSKCVSGFLHQTIGLEIPTIWSFAWKTAAGCFLAAALLKVHRVSKEFRDQGKYLAFDL